MSHHFHNLKIKDLRRETSETVSIAFEIPENLKNEFSYSSGQYITLRREINGEDLRRSYSICSAPYENELRVAVKQVLNGQFSTFANTELKAGDELDVLLPEGNFKVEPKSGDGKNYVFYAAGSGITPVIAMIKDILKTDLDSDVFLYYGNTTRSNIIFKAELDQLNENHRNFHLTYILSREESGYEFTDGRIDEDKCSYFFENEHGELKLEGIYTCGPQSMIETIKEFYTSKGLLHKVYFELFKVTAAPPKKEGENGKVIRSQVTVIIDDEEVEFELDSDGKSILQAAQDADADVPFSCKGGVCCTCKAKVLEGSAKMDLNYALDDSEVEEGFILTCQAHPTSEKIIVSYDEY